MKHNFAVTITRTDSTWQVHTFDDDYSDLQTSVRAVRNLRAEGASFALLCVEDDYFVVVRPTPTKVKYLLSDASAASEDDFAASILEELDVEIPEAGEDPWAEGDFDILADIGLSGQIMALICDETDWWASEQVQRLAEELGVEDELEQALAPSSR
ncbi:putative tRNA adenosine deaminase-associated protein [Corynebacterium kutscheri]|uniref:tRNA adenosine deaminase-associated protein n=1 Tax=Corynebacterium kutscheri TaxID=35755 RepID=A0A0F6QYW1_9CORY|nr:tRNA adenosine deaminase-associated protein [Corynebacterium kutscheri]AKE40355.1 putative tRNA adenosine deaminase-associated protein [Corynebacterium kutscheri]VEH05371.1 putative tRNA adenosine deaminase-associated protein [Corynebacterium kutscheri]VEH10749.1 putative tRNA adenosine deaminase-associated protein [Corynebacterium kutscheri]VEH80771.1 putative tRNA adenosine deaminase-associated protein [Corynebacterium kutscheri]